MPLASGQSILHYRLVEKIGQGGMGEVWRATDTRLDRDVALKFLPDAVTHDPARLERFAREAKTLASLDDPGIASIFGIEEHDGHRFLVMERVPGEDLSEVLERGPLPLSDALDVAIRIARAVEVAHGQGVVHRDLKPANVKRTPDGRIKVLDFGLAKVLGPEVSSGGSDHGMSPTLTSAGTAAGVILGTAAYMSPEQARGRPVDKRTDVWSFGVVLYELLTGDNPFRGETVADSVGAILHREPDLDRLPPGTPSPVRRVLRRCLTRKRRQRLHDIADARIELEEALENPAADLPPAPTVERSPSRAPWIALAVVVPIVALIGWWIGSRPVPVPPDPVRQFELVPDREVDLAQLSPDGTKLVYRADDTLYLRSLDSLDSRALTEIGDEPVHEVAWSPDGRSLALTRTAGRIDRLDLGGGAPVRLTEFDAFVAGPVWADDGHIYFDRFQDGIHRVPATGGASERVLERFEQMIDFHGMDVLPGGGGILTIPHLQQDEYRRIYLTRPGGEPELLYESDALIGGVSYSPTGHVLFHRTEEPRGLWALPFSVRSLEVTGDPILVVPDLGSASVSARGDMVYTRAALQWGKRKQQIVWADRSGAIVERLDKPLYGSSAVIPSPDGTRLAVVARGVGRPASGKPNLWVVDLERGSATQLTRTGISEAAPTWSEDGNRIAYLQSTSSPGTTTAVQVVRADGAGEPETLFDAQVTYTYALDRTWSRAVYMSGSLGDERGVRIASRSLDDPDTEVIVVDSPLQDVVPTVHPDGNWLAYGSGNLVSMDTFVRPFPTGEGRFKASVGAGGFPFWSAGGDRLYYVELVERMNESRVVEVPFDGSGARPVLGTPTPLFTPGATAGVVGIDRDDRFVYVVDAGTEDGEEADTAGIVFVQDWLSRFAE